jgi:Pyruvate/2-oxoacid:ferredoxin oxidoreductase delta subunit
MCEFCTQHGEGEKWYLTMRNYSMELWSQNQRADFLDEFLARFEEDWGTKVAQLDAVRRLPVVYKFIRRTAVRQQKANHWGQVVPLEDAERVIDLQDSIVRLPCVCRSLTTGQQARYCFGIGVDPPDILGKYPDYSYNLERMEKEEAKQLLRAFDKQGMVHSVWTFKTPYIGGLCNCDQDCLAYRTQVKTDLTSVMFRAEYVAMVDWDVCSGCKKCLLQCQYGAIRFSNTAQKATIEMRQCYGCGVCRAVCKHDAISLKPRAEYAELPW